MALEVNVSLTLPRDEMTVPVARHLCDVAMGELGVTAACRADVVLALSEACTNAVEHSSANHPYAVHISIDDHCCSIQVKGGDETDVAATHAADRRMPSPEAEEGRGVHLMQQLVDSVAFSTAPGNGTVVDLRKDLQFDRDHPATRRLLR
jgi:serine/threonine-protein kinase RsbW